MNLAHRSREPEILDRSDIPEQVRRRCYRDLALTQRWLGNWRAVLNLLAEMQSLRTVLDIGCGHGALAQEIHRRLGVMAVGVDTHPPARGAVPIVRADAVRDPLPPADAAVCLMMAHHLSDEELAALIRNVGRSCRRFVILDLVRALPPILLFRTFVAPWIHRINALDGVRSIERSFTPAEMRGIVAGTGVNFRQRVAPFSVRQIIDIRY